MKEVEGMGKDEKKVIWALLNSVPLIFLAIVAPIAAYKGIYIFPGESVESWFQRSGSVTVLFAVWTEYNLSKANGYISPSGIITNEQEELSNKYKLAYNLIRYFGVLLAIVGTMIWGYGDLIY